MNQSQVSISGSEHGVEDVTAEPTDDVTTSNMEIIASDSATLVSHDSKGSEMRPFPDYLPRIEQLMNDIGLQGFSVEPIQHGYSFQNCVYALRSNHDRREQYILRVPTCPDLGETCQRCDAILNNVSLMGLPTNRLDVHIPQIRAYSAITDNALNSPFEIQTKLPSQPLSNVYPSLAHEEKLAIIDQLVELLAKLEAVNFDAAGKFTASASLPATTAQVCVTTKPSISMFAEGDEEFVSDPKCLQDRAGPDVKALLESHLNGWIAKELKGDEVHRSFIVPPYQKLLGILSSLYGASSAEDRSEPVILHHWDLQPRNIMVEKSSDSWRICGIIDWDEVEAVPRSLARKPPDWIWDFDPELFTGYLDYDFHPSRSLSAEDLTLKAYFDSKATESLLNYLKNAYGRGRWLRRIWTLVRNEIHSSWYLELMDQLIKDWEVCDAEKLKGVWKRSLDWLLWRRRQAFR